MLSLENARIEDRILKLLSRFSFSFTHNILIPEIESNCDQYKVEPVLAENFQRYKCAENSLYFAHSYAYADIPTGQKYELIARISSEGKIIPDSILRCETTVLCFFSNFRTHPQAFANHGHHEICLIQFHGGIPKIVNELTEFTENSRFLEYKQRIGLFSYETLKANERLGQLWQERDG